MSRVKRPGAGAGWPGRREGTVAEPRARPRTPPGGDRRRPFRVGRPGGAHLQVLLSVVERGDLERRALVDGRGVPRDPGRLVGVVLVERLVLEQRVRQRVEVLAMLVE